MQHARPIAAALAAALLAPAVGEADVIRLRADDWCPYNCDPASDRPGFMIEIAREIFEEAGHELDYQTLNWVRSIETARRGKVEGVVGAVPEEAPDFVFPVQELGMNRDAYVVRAEDLEAASADHVGFLQGNVLAAIRGYEYVKEAANHIDAHADDPSRVQFTSGDDALEQNLRKLVAGRVDVVIDDANVLRGTLAHLGLNDRVGFAWQDEIVPLHVAFSPATPKAAEYARLLDEGVARLRADGRLDAILARYGLTDWR